MIELNRELNHAVFLLPVVNHESGFIWWLNELNRIRITAKMNLGKSWILVRVSLYMFVKTADTCSLWKWNTTEFKLRKCLCSFRPREQNYFSERDSIYWHSDFCVPLKSRKSSLEFKLWHTKHFLILNLATCQSRLVISIF